MQCLSAVHDLSVAVPLTFSSVVVVRCEAKAVNDREGSLLREARDLTADDHNSCDLSNSNLTNALHDSIELRVVDRLKCANHSADHARASIAAAKDLLSPPFAILWVWPFLALSS